MGMICVNCGRELYEDRCKARCPHCGYFEDCSDPSAPGEWAPAGRTGRGEGTPGRDGPEGSGT
jgi:hypothetical protein